MAEELNVGRLVAEIALEAETEKAKQDTKNAVDKIKEDIKSIETTDAAPKINWDKIHSEWKKNEEEIARYMGNIEIPVAIVPEKMGASDAIKDINIDAVKLFKAVLEQFKAGEAKYKKDILAFSVQLSQLVHATENDLLPETMLYHSDVYNHIFSTINDDQKYLLTKFTIEQRGILE